MNQDKSATINEIDREMALRIAREDAVKNFGTIADYGLFDCQQGPFWRVYFESLDIKRSQRVLELILLKKGGLVVARRELSLKVSAGENSSRPSASNGIAKTDAINIAEKDAAQAYGSLTKFRLTVCELKNAWRVIYAPEEHLNGGGPEYLIDKNTGGILDKQYYQ